MNWRKIVKIAILVIIPLLATFFIGRYGYNYYAGKTQIKIDYYENVEANTAAQVDAFMKYNEYKFEENPIKTYEAKNGETSLLKLEVYRAVYLSSKDSEEKGRYIFVIYDVNTTNILNKLVATAGEQAKDFNTPALSLTCMPTNTEDFSESDAVSPVTLSTTSARGLDGVFGIVDYVASEVNGKDKDEIDPFTSTTYTGAYYARWNIEESFDEDFGNEFTLQLKATALNKSDSSDDVKLEEVILELTDVTFDLTAENWNVDNMVEGYNNDEIKAGYFGWVLGHYLWWICLITLVLSFALTFVFVAVWEYDDVTSNQGKKNKK